ncbi:MAG TPA: SUMF1/EgtB/PvdO family nonheme iron enzyme [Acidobacteriota bacterium]|nr:SUMF1/EgtB/PvdO family nonheme iron enzyme [Acidobacteriota bacterium]
MAEETPPRKRRTFLVLLFGIILGVAVALASHYSLDYTSTDQFCDQVCHAHPQATQLWIRSTHYMNKSGVVTHCIDCHLPPEGIDYLTEKARLGAQDVYGKLFKDLKKIDWEGKRTLENARTFTYDVSCVRCHKNLFSQGLSKKGSDAHLYYQRMKEKVRCINCHLSVGHFMEKKPEQPEELMASAVTESPEFPLIPQGFKNYTELIPGSTVKFRMVALPSGTFMMGSPASEPYRRPDEGPVHPVRVSQFWMGQTEVSWREFEIFYAQRKVPGKNEGGPDSPDAQTGPTPPYGSPDQGWGKGSRPVITLTHHCAEVYCKWLSEVTGKRFRLPTEAEWEYACRAATTTPYFFAGNPSRFTARSWLNRLRGVSTSPIGEYAWYSLNSQGKTHLPTEEKPNPWNLLNMLGNVKEFCLDWYDPHAYAQSSGSEPVADPRGPETGEEHVIRGGSFRSDAADLRAAARDYTRTEAWLVTDPQNPKSIWWYSDEIDVGFRVVREFGDGLQPDKGGDVKSVASQNAN